MRRPPARSDRFRERGAVLYIALILLVILTLIAVAAARLQTGEAVMARNEHNHQLAVQAAEAALRDAETNLVSGGTWTLAGAKARLSEVVNRAQAGPQIITRNGKPSAVVVSTEEWARKTSRKGTLAEFLLASPLRGAELDLERLRDTPNDVTL